MPDQTAADRAAEVLRYPLHDEDGLLPPLVADAVANHQAAALVANPDLLVDLAIEAGGLVQALPLCGWVDRYEDDAVVVTTGVEDSFALSANWRRYGGPFALYRRREANDA